MAIGRVARKLYSQQGEFGTVRKAYKEAFRRQMIANYAPANVIGRMFGFGSMFHTMAKKAFGVPEWNPRSLETGRPDIVPGQQARGRQGAARSTAMMRASDMVLADIAENTERTADAMENINKIAALEQKKEDLGENFKREQEFEENLKRIKPISVEKVGEASSLSDSSSNKAMGAGLAALFSGLLKLGDSLWKVALGGAAGLALGGMAIKGAGRLLLRFGPVGMILGGLYSGIEEYMKTGSFKTAISQFFGGVTGGLLGPEFQNSLKDAAKKASTRGTTLFNQAKGGGGYVSTNTSASPSISTSASDSQGYSFWNDSALGRFLKRPFEPTGSAAAQEIVGGKPVVRTKIAPMPPSAARTSPTPVSVAPAASSVGGMSSDIPPEGQKLLNAISRTESGGAYNAIVGSGKYGAPATFSDYSDHPRIKGVGLTKAGGEWLHVNDPRQRDFSTAAGKYQITARTWDALRARYPDLTDFSPKNQDKAAWYLAQEDYKRRTGNDLTQDLKDSSKAGSIGQALSATWTSLPGGMESQVSASKFAQSMTSTTPPLNVAAATTAARSTQAAASTAAGATSFQSSMTAPQAMSTTIVNNLPPTAFGASPQMNESVDEFVTRVMVAMGIVVQT